MKIKIISNGIATGTKVINEETGEHLEGVTEIIWRCKVKEFAEVELKLINIPVEVIGKLKK
jgi:hypothetical protein